MLSSIDLPFSLSLSQVKKLSDCRVHLINTERAISNSDSSAASIVGICRLAFYRTQKMHSNSPVRAREFYEARIWICDWVGVPGFIPINSWFVRGVHAVPTGNKVAFATALGIEVQLKSVPIIRQMQIQLSLRNKNRSFYNLTCTVFSIWHIFRCVRYFFCESQFLNFTNHWFVFFTTLVLFYRLICWFFFFCILWN